MHYIYFDFTPVMYISQGKQPLTHTKNNAYLLVIILCLQRMADLAQKICCWAPDSLHTPHLQASVQSQRSLKENTFISIYLISLPISFFSDNTALTHAVP